VHAESVAKFSSQAKPGTIEQQLPQLFLSSAMVPALQAFTISCKDTETGMPGMRVK